MSGFWGSEFFLARMALKLILFILFIARDTLRFWARRKLA